MGARLYTMYIYSLTQIIQHHGIQYHTYADDLQLYMKCHSDDNSINQAIFQLQNCIADITELMSNNTLKINEDKTEFIIFNIKGKSENKYTIEIGNNVIHMSEHAKILGVYLDTAMTLEKQISTTCRTA